MFQSTSSPYTSVTRRSSPIKIFPSPSPERILTPEKGSTKNAKTSPSPKPRRTESDNRVEKFSTPITKYQSVNLHDCNVIEDTENILSENDEMTPSKSFKVVAKLFPSHCNIPHHHKTKSFSSIDKNQSPNKQNFDEVKFLDSLPQVYEANRIKIELYRLKMENQRLTQQREVIVKHCEAEITELRENFQKELYKLDKEKSNSAKKSNEVAKLQQYIDVLEARIKLKETFAKQMEIKLETNQIINRNLEEQVRSLMSIAENQQKKIESIHKIGLNSPSEEDSARRIFNNSETKFDFKKLEQDLIDERDKIRYYSNKSTSDRSKAEENFDEKDFLMKQLDKIRKENSDLSSILKAQLLSSQKTVEEKDSIISQLTVELEQIKELSNFQATELNNYKLDPKMTFAEGKIIQREPQNDITKDLKTVMLMIEIERLHAIIRELSEHLFEQQAAIDRINSQDLSDLSLEKHPPPLKKETEYDQGKADDKRLLKSQFDRLAEEFRKTDLKSYFNRDSFRSDNETTSHISERRGSTPKINPGNHDLPEFLPEKVPESTFKSEKLEAEIEKLNGLLSDSRQEIEKLKKKNKELEDNHTKQVEYIENVMGTFVKNKIMEELKQYEMAWNQEKESRDKIIENQKGLISKLKQKIIVLTQDLHELTQIKARESTLLSRIEKKGTELNDDFLVDQNF